MLLTALLSSFALLRSWAALVNGEVSRHPSETTGLIQKSSPMRRHLDQAAQEGEPCGSSACAAGLQCQCLALNRGLHVCTKARLFDPPASAKRFERQGLHCEARLPSGARPMAPPPLVPLEGAIVDPRGAEQPAELRQWAQEYGKGFYSQYVLVHDPSDALLGVPVLAGPDVKSETVKAAAATIQHLLLESTVSNATLRDLVRWGVRLLISAPESEKEAQDAWLSHPEVSRRFTTGLGGGSPWFPSTGIQAGEDQATLVEEMFHTIQYCAMEPRLVCMYRKSYKDAMEKGLYTTDNSGSEVDGEPVPTVQADEYFAMALHRWLGSTLAEDEYKVSGNRAHKTGRQSLQERDLNAFCLLSTLFRADDTWNPEPLKKPWKNHKNEAMDRVAVAKTCRPVLEELREGCPAEGVSWPDRRPRIIP